MWTELGVPTDVGGVAPPSNLTMELVWWEISGRETWLPSSSVGVLLPGEKLPFLPVLVRIILLLNGCFTPVLPGEHSDDVSEFRALTPMTSPAALAVVLPSGTLAKFPDGGEVVK